MLNTVIAPGCGETVGGTLLPSDTTFQEKMRRRDRLCMHLFGESHGDGDETALLSEAIKEIALFQRRCFDVFP